MHRRQYLTRTCAGAVGLAALAGCLGDDDAAPPVRDRTGERELDRAVGDLNRAALELVEETDVADDPAATEFDPSEPSARIVDARDHLETAEAELDADREADVETVRTYADILERLVAVTETLTDDAAASDVDAAFGAIEDDGDREDAAETLAEWTDRLEEARTRYDAAQADVEAFDDRFEELARIDRAELEEGLETLGDVLAPLEALGEGLESTLAGYGDLERGQTHFEDREFGRAETAFADAGSRFASATETYDAAEPPSGLAGDFETARCQSDHLTAAATAFEDAAAAADAGDAVTAARRRDDGERSLESARNCA